MSEVSERLQPRQQTLADEYPHRVRPSTFAHAVLMTAELTLGL